MFILTLDSKSPQEIIETLEKLVKEMKKWPKIDDTMGLIGNNVDFEFLILKNQQYVSMTKFLPLDENKCLTLKKE